MNRSVVTITFYVIYSCLDAKMTRDAFTDKKVRLCRGVNGRCEEHTRKDNHIGISAHFRSILVFPGFSNGIRALLGAGYFKVFGKDLS